MPFPLPAIIALVLATPCWSPPIVAPVTEPYGAPACTYCPGNRGIEYGPRPGQAVIAVAGGTVSFAGGVAGTRYVVVDHRDGIRATYGRLSTMAVARGADVVAGQRLGTTSDSFYFGLRHGVAPDEVPVDPTPMLGTAVYPARLVPVDGTPALAVGAGRLSCRNAGPGR
jgi:murein DD-endopeptidase MepM/ murein hydrolase activator NlpD